MTEIRTVLDDAPTVGAFLLCLAVVSDNPRRLCMRLNGHSGGHLPLTSFPRTVKDDQ